jgi:hypothetical protein
MLQALPRFLLIVSLSIPLFSCSPSPSEVQATEMQVSAFIFSTQTAQAPTITLTLTPSPTSTATPTHTPTPTTTPNQIATHIAAVQESRLTTQQARETANAIEAQQTQVAEDALFTLFEQDGAITELKKGSLIEPDDFDESWAQRGWYQWWAFGMDLADFVFITHIEWEVPTLHALGQTGCGFVFRAKDEYHHLLLYLDIGGLAFAGHMNPSGYKNISTSWKIDDLKSDRRETSSADFMAVAEKDMMTVYVNGVKTQRFSLPIMDSGDMGYTLISGTNKDFGINCKMTDTRIYELVK